MARKTKALVKPQGTLKPERNSWDNELHPAKAGFNTFVDMFRHELKAAFANRIP